MMAMRDELEPSAMQRTMNSIVGAGTFIVRSGSSAARMGVIGA
jgi:hypothetical protein